MPGRKAGAGDHTSSYDTEMDVIEDTETSNFIPPPAGETHRAGSGLGGWKAASASLLQGVQLREIFNFPWEVQKQWRWGQKQAMSRARRYERESAILRFIIVVLIVGFSIATFVFVIYANVYTFFSGHGGSNKPGEASSADSMRSGKPADPSHSSHVHAHPSTLFNNTNEMQNASNQSGWWRGGNATTWTEYEFYYHRTQDDAQQALAPGNESSVQPSVPPPQVTAEEAIHRLEDIYWNATPPPD